MLEIVSREKVDIVLLDIRMPEMDGMEAARHLAGMAQPPAHHLHDRLRRLRDQGLRGERDRLPPEADPGGAAARGAAQGAGGGAQPREALAAAANQPRRHLSVHERGKIHLVPVADILYLRAELKYVTVRTAAREFLVEESLTRLEEEFGEAFVRIHRNCLVARAAIEGFEKHAEESESGWAVVIRGTGERLAVSRRQQHVVKEFR